LEANHDIDASERVYTKIFREQEYPKMVCQQDDLLPEQTIEGLSDELIEEEYKLLSKLAEGTTDDMNRPNPPIKPLHCRLE